MAEFISLNCFLMSLLGRCSLSASNAFLALVALSFVQGVGQAFYMAANTTLIARRFQRVAYVVGMAEVSVGLGAQLGRLGGGGLYDLGGFACPFLTTSLRLAEKSTNCY